MVHYRLFAIKAEEGFCSSQTIVARDDADGIAVARAFEPTGEAELWCGRRLVRAFEREDAHDTAAGAPPSTTATITRSDRHS